MSVCKFELGKEDEDDEGRWVWGRGGMCTSLSHSNHGVPSRVPCVGRAVLHGW